MTKKAARPQQTPRDWIRFGLATAAALGMAWPAAAQIVIDGDTIKLDGISHELYGIDAPEARHICADGWPAGREAEEYLGKLIDGKQISCIRISRNRDGDPVAICKADGVDLGAAMVTGGYAFAFVPYSARYVSQEDAATSARRGVHAHHCLSPWKWRGRLRKGE